MFQQDLDEGYWDEILREEQYFKFQEDPTRKPEGEKGRTIGEFDILAVNYEDKVALYTEIKTNAADLDYAEKQVKRAEEFFEDTEWEVIGRTYLAAV